MNSFFTAAIAMFAGGLLALTTSFGVVMSQQSAGSKPIDSSNVSYGSKG